MVKYFNLPDVGEGLTEADIVRWHVAPGDTVEVNQTIVEIETAKAIVELPSPFAGTVRELLAEEGQTVDVGAPIIGVEEAGAEAPAAPPAQSTSVEGGAQPARTPVLVGYGVKPGATQRRPRKGSPAPGRPGGGPARPSGPRQPEPPDRQGDGLAARLGRAEAATGRALAKPPVRKLAKDLGVDLTTVVGTGPRGSVTRDDVRAAMAAPAPEKPSAAPAPPPGTRETEAAPTASGGERVPVKGVRRAMAAAMVSSAFTAPHVTEFLQVDVTRTVRMVEKLRGYPEYRETRFSPMLLAARALVLALRRHPMANAAWTERDGHAEIVVPEHVNLGIAVATDRGLLVPNVKRADTLPLPELAGALADLAERARAGKATPDDLAGGTVTLTNVGVFGVDAGTPILTPGETAILAVGAIRDLPWVHKGKVKPRKVATLALSFDHRVLDGAQGSAVLRDVGGLLEDPFHLLARS
ncbi:dihydrolipoamide acetyltransferase family protein [Actinocorallia sp. A-T 12471]|uniref:dihydrolipoamide acetyltransferase family protein n=1 Tax=Actinocorallia sp. A-T 12471 TaxID=3089813 RepID=UPI0029CF705C|nr:dihydrolipoamide acetyltransferase family protein [Actinocorallia sp. A-T 12471]MDX6741903.1 dihydrolipoamide acetyltransferase family protein [Actinocorallia sp. A-T 12471]